MSHHTPSPQTHYTQLGQQSHARAYTTGTAFSRTCKHMHTHTHTHIHTHTHTKTHMHTHTQVSACLQAMAALQAASEGIPPHTPRAQPKHLKSAQRSISSSRISSNNAVGRRTPSSIDSNSSSSGSSSGGRMHKGRTIGGVPGSLWQSLQIGLVHRLASLIPVPPPPSPPPPPPLPSNATTHNTDNSINITTKSDDATTNNSNNSTDNNSFIATKSHSITLTTPPHTVPLVSGKSLAQSMEALLSMGACLNVLFMCVCVCVCVCMCVCVCVCVSKLDIDLCRQQLLLS